MRKDLHLTWPRAETPTAYITIGTDEDLIQAAKITLREMVAYLQQAKHFSKDDAYMLASVAANLEITQVVDSTRGAHMLLPQNIFVTPKKRE